MDEKASRVKYTIPEGAISRKAIFTTANKPLIRAMKKAGKDLSGKIVSTATVGNVSMRTAGGFIITATGSKLASLSDDDFVEILEFDSGAFALKRAEGLETPSSETPMHSKVYASRPDVNAIIHFHDPSLQSEKAAQKLKVPINAEPVPKGTKESADAAALLLAGGAKAAILKDHGVIVAAPTIEDGVELALLLHRRAP